MTLFLSREHVEQFRALIASRLGLHHDDGKVEHISDVLRQRMEAVGISRCESYFELLAPARNKTPTGEFRTLAELLTVNETFFFRNADNFRAFSEVVLPERIRAKARERRLRILSAGCASGEEPYTLAMLVREALPDFDSWDVEIVGVDVNPTVIAKARAARYSAWSLRATPEDAKRRYFTPEGRDFALAPSIQRMVRFEERNLVEEDPIFWQSLSFDVVFCRNVLMYFTPDSARDVVRRASQALLPGGFFFLGHAETLRGLTHDFHLCHTHDTFYYRLRNAQESVGAIAARQRNPMDPAENSLPALVESAASWFEVIQRASERIATLAGKGSGSPSLGTLRSGQAASVDQVPEARPWDLAFVLESLRQERYSDAFELLCNLPPDSQDDPDALLLRAVLLTNNGRLQESEEVCDRLLALDELNAGAHYLMALCREHSGDSGGAIEHQRTAIHLDPAFAMPHLHLGIMAKRAGENDKAVRELDQARILLAREDGLRLLLFGGGFSREVLLELCQTERDAARSGG